MHIVLRILDDRLTYTMYWLRSLVFAFPPYFFLVLHTLELIQLTTPSIPISCFLLLVALSLQLLCTFCCCFVAFTIRCSMHMKMISYVTWYQKYLRSYLEKNLHYGCKPYFFTWSHVSGLKNCVDWLLGTLICFIRCSWHQTHHILMM